MNKPLIGYNPKEMLWRTEYDRILSSLTQNTLIYGGSQSGKTTTLAAISTKLEQFILLPLRYVGVTPEHFALDIVSIILCQLKDNWNNYTNYRGITNILKHISLLPPQAQQAVHTIDNELQKIKPNQKLLIESALSIPSLLNIPTVIVDDAQRILELSHYETLKEPFSILSMFSTRWLLAFEQPITIKGFTPIPLPPFTLEETKKILDNYSLDQSVVTQIHQYSRGIPTLSLALASTYDNKRSVKRHYTHQLLHEKSALNQYAHSYLTSLLNQARGATLLEVVLRILAENGSLTLSEIGRKLFRPAPVTQSILLRLLEVGLIQKDGRLFSITSPILHDYILLNVLGLLGQDITTAVLNEAEGRL